MAQEVNIFFQIPHASVLVVANAFLRSRGWWTQLHSKKKYTLFRIILCASRKGAHVFYHLIIFACYWMNKQNKSNCRAFRIFSNPYHLSLKESCFWIWHPLILMLMSAAGVICELIVSRVEFCTKHSVSGSFRASEGYKFLPWTVNHAGSWVEAIIFVIFGN